MLTKKQILSELKEVTSILPWLKDEGVVGFSGAMNLMGIIEHSNDIDVAVPYSRLDEVKESGKFTFSEITIEDSEEVRIVANYKNTDLHFGDMFIKDTVISLSGWEVMTPESILSIKTQWNRPKDQKHISILKVYIGKEG